MTIKVLDDHLLYDFADGSPHKSEIQINLPPFQDIGDSLAPHLSCILSISTGDLRIKLSEDG